MTEINAIYHPVADPDSEFLAQIGNRFSVRLREARKLAGLTQMNAARLVGTDLKTWGQWERGYRVPHAWRLLHLSYIFSVSVDWLLARDDFEPPPPSNVLRGWGDSNGE